jgi:hypothetical protein
VEEEKEEECSELVEEDSETEGETTVPIIGTTHEVVDGSRERTAGSTESSGSAES